MTREPKPGYAKRVRDVFERQAFLGLIGAELGALGPGTAELSLRSRPDLEQQTGFLHGGVVASLADVAAGFAALTLFEPGAEILTVEFKVNLLAPAKGDLLFAQGEVLKSGRTLTVCAMRVYAQTGTDRVLCAAGQQTLMQLQR